MTPELAAGVLCWRRARDGLEVLLVHRPRYDDWSWPKGKTRASEVLPVTAVREAAEETGLVVRLGRPLGQVRYLLEDGRPKEVTYWAAVSTGIVQGEPRLDLAYQEDSAADVDFNFVLTDSGKFVEIQGTAESEPFSSEEYGRMVDLAKIGAQQLFAHQREALAKAKTP